MLGIVIGSFAKMQPEAKFSKLAGLIKQSTGPVFRKGIKLIMRTFHTSNFHFIEDLTMTIIIYVCTMCRPLSEISGNKYAAVQAINLTIQMDGQLTTLRPLRTYVECFGTIP